MLSVFRRRRRRCRHENQYLLTCVYEVCMGQEDESGGARETVKALHHHRPT